MKTAIWLAVVLTTVALAGSGCIVAPVGPPPEPVVEVYGTAPYPGAVWVAGDWRWHSGHRGYEWHRGYWRR